MASQFCVTFRRFNSKTTMIQRLQTILFFLAAVLCVAFLFFPTWSVINPDDGEGGSRTLIAYPMKVRVEISEMNLDHPFSKSTLSVTDNTFLMLQFILVVATVLVLLVTIFLYGKRPLQIKVAYAAVFLLMLMFLTLIPVRSWLEEMGGDPAAAGSLYQSIPQWGLGAPLTAMLLTWWGVKRIQKDEKLVKGMDRLR
jgi:small-conductance mechanosensitive channel